MWGGSQQRLKAHESEPNQRKDGCGGATLCDV